MLKQKLKNKFRLCCLEPCLQLEQPVASTRPVLVLTDFLLLTGSWRSSVTGCKQPCFPFGLLTDGGSQTSFSSSRRWSHPIMLHYQSVHPDPGSHLAGSQNEAREVQKHTHDTPAQTQPVWDNRLVFQRGGSVGGSERRFVSFSSGQQFVFTAAARCQLSKQRERFLFLLPLSASQQVRLYILLAEIMLLLAHICTKQHIYGFITELLMTQHWRMIVSDQLL